ncbi:uncharacterized protein [Solanum lycopersicum]|uniref:uncharacterized protein n=1 Tax=Solanum lycopersicum TaxID=4081 RepID=UPI00374827F8
MTVREYFLKFFKLSNYATSLVSNSTDEMRKFLTGINRDLEEECQFPMPHDSIDLSRTMVHFQQVEDSRKKKGVRDARRPKPQDHACPSNGGNRKNFGVREQPRFKKGQPSLGNSNSQRSTTPRGGRPKPSKGNRGSMLSFVAPLLPLTFKIFPKVLHDPIVWYNSISPNPCISNLKANKMMSKGLLCHLLSVNDLEHDIPSIESVPVVNEFQDVFPDDLPGVPPLERLTLVYRQHQLFAKSSKCEFLLRSMTFLDHVLSNKGVEVDPKKTEWDFYSIAAPLTTLTKKKVKFEWEDACEKSFLELEDTLTSSFGVSTEIVEALLVWSACGCVHRPQKSLVGVHTKGVESTLAKMVGAVEGL